MKLSIVFLNKIEYLEDILSAYLEVGVSGATVLESVGMGHIISQNIPIFAGLKDNFTGSSPQNKMILAVVNEEMIDTIGEVVEDVCGGLDDPGTAFLVSLPIDKILGLKTN